MVRSIARLDGRARVLAGVALAWVLVARALLRFSSRPITEQERLLARVGACLPVLSGYEVALAAWAITAAVRYVPGARCLAWSLALRGLLGQMGMGSSLRIGVAPIADGPLEAHAWVDCDGRDWSWGGDAVDRYRVLLPADAATPSG
jgi:hypothetical protein